MRKTTEIIKRYYKILFILFLCRCCVPLSLPKRRNISPQIHYWLIYIYIYSFTTFMIILLYYLTATLPCINSLSMFNWIDVKKIVLNVKLTNRVTIRSQYKIVNWKFMPIYSVCIFCHIVCMYDNDVEIAHHNKK